MSIALVSDKPKSRLHSQDEAFLRSLPADGQRLLARFVAAFSQYEKALEDWMAGKEEVAPSLPEVTRFVPTQKVRERVKFMLWKGNARFNPLTMEEEGEPSEWLEITHSGHLPRTLEEAKRLLVLACKPNSYCAITTWENREAPADVKDLERENAQLRAEKEADKIAFDRIKAELEAMKGKK